MRSRRYSLETGRASCRVRVTGDWSSDVCSSDLDLERDWERNLKNDLERNSENDLESDLESDLEREQERRRLPIGRRPRLRARALPADGQIRLAKCGRDAIVSRPEERRVG